MQRAVRLILVLVIAGHLAFTIWIDAVYNVWIDEYFSMHTTSGDLAFALRQTLDFEGQPPLYFLLLWVWRQVSESVVWSRMLSGVFILAMLGVMWRISTRLFPKMHPLWLVGLAAFNPLTVHAASEMRVTALMLLLSSLIMLFFVEGFLTVPKSKRPIVAYGAVCVLALYTHYYLGFLLLANGIAVLATRRWRTIAAYYATMAVVGVCFVPMLWEVAHHVGKHSATQPADMQSLGADARYVILRAQKYVWPMPDLNGLGVGRWLFTAITGLGIAIVAVRHRRTLTSTPVAIWASTAVFLACFVFLVSRFGQTMVAYRHMASLMVPTYLCVYLAVNLLKDRERRAVLVSWTFVVAASTVLALYAANWRMAKSGDWKRVAAYIEANEKPNEPILVFTSDMAWLLRLYYDGANEIIPLPREDDFTVYNMEKHALTSVKDIDAALAASPNRSSSLWAVNTCWMDHCQWLGVDFHAEVLEAFLARDYQLDSSKEFYDCMVRRFEKSATRPGE